MSDEDKDVDVESDDDDHDMDDDDLASELSAAATANMTPAQKRAHHNALERKRRDHIKDSFHSLRNSVPMLRGEKSHASRALILKKATEYIEFMCNKNRLMQMDIEKIKKENNSLEQNVRILERAQSTKSGGGSGSSGGDYPSASTFYEEDGDGTGAAAEWNADAANNVEDHIPEQRCRKRMKTGKV